MNKESGIKKIIDFISRHNAFVIALELVVFIGIVFTFVASNYNPLNKQFNLEEILPGSYGTGNQQSAINDQQLADLEELKIKETGTEKYGSLNPKTSWLGEFLDNHPEYASMPIVKQNANSIHFQRPDGKIVAHFLGGPIHYQDEQGDWQPINTALKQNGDELTGSGTLAKIKTDGTVLVSQDHTHKTSGYGWYNPETQTFIPIQDLPAGKIEENKFVREAKDFRHQLIMLDSGLKEEMTLYEKPKGGQDKDYLVIQTTITGLDFPDGELGEYTYQGLTFPYPKCFDAEEKEVTCQRFAQRQGNIQFVYTGIPVAELAHAIYPVVIDPDFTGSTADGYIQGASSSYATARSTSQAFGSTGTFMMVGQQFVFSTYYVYRGFLKFDTNSIPDTDTVTQVNLKLTARSDDSDTDFDVQIIKQDWSGQDPLSDANREAAYDNCLAGTQDDNIWRNTSGIILNTQYASSNLSTSWVNKAGNTYYSLRSNRDYDNITPTGNEYLRIYSADETTVGYRPVLTVLYEAGPTRGRVMIIE